MFSATEWAITTSNECSTYISCAQTHSTHTHAYICIIATAAAHVMMPHDEIVCYRFPADTNDTQACATDRSLWDNVRESSRSRGKNSARKRQTAKLNERHAKPHMTRNNASGAWIHFSFAKLKTQRQCVAETTHTQRVRSRDERASAHNDNRKLLTFLSEHIPSHLALCGTKAELEFIQNRKIRAHFCVSFIILHTPSQCAPLPSRSLTRARSPNDGLDVTPKIQDLLLLLL